MEEVSTDHFVNLRAPVLVIDDEEMILQAVKQILDKLGHAAVTARNAEEALALVEKEAFSVVISDQRMDGMTGLDLLAEVKRLQPNATRVLMTGVLDMRTIIDSINDGGIYRFVVKPWIQEELVATVQNSVQRYELLQSNARLQEQTRGMNAQLKSLNQSLKEQIAKTEEKCQKLEVLSDVWEGNLEVFVEVSLKLLSAFQPALGEQARLTCNLCRQLAQDVGLSSQDKQILDIAANLHDIGLISVPRRLISLAQENPDQLNEEERRKFEQHPVTGQKLLGYPHPLKDAGLVIRAHHERFDGTGYPDHRAGEDIPWPARLLAAAGFFIESPLDEAATAEILSRESGTRFDPNAADAVLRCSNQSGRKTREQSIVVADLQPGMVLAKCIYTADGTLLAPEGQILDETEINRIRQQHQISPLEDSLLVYC